MRLGLSFILLGLCHGQISCVREAPPFSVVGSWNLSRQSNGFTLIDGDNVQITFAPASAGTTAGVLKMVNSATTPRWVRLIAQGVSVDLSIPPSRECKTNLVLINLQGANIFKPK